MQLSGVPAYVTFALGPDGGVERISMRAVSPIADFSFDYQDLDFRPGPIEAYRRSHPVP